MKALTEILNPDVRQAALVTLDIGGWRPMEVRDCHRPLESILVMDAVPEAVRKQFDIARDLMLYGWFVYEFYTVAVQQAYACLEFGLREACKKVNNGENPCEKKKGLACYITWAEKNGLIPAGKYHEELRLFVPALRNSIGHGSSTLFNYALAMPTLEIVADLLNVVFGSEEVKSKRQQNMVSDDNGKGGASSC